MRILLILILVAAGVLAWQAHKHGCKYDRTIFSCAFGTSGSEPAAEAPAPAPEAPAPAPEAPAPEAPAPAQ